MSLTLKRKARYYAGKKDTGLSSLEKQTTKAQVEATCPICQETVGSRNAEGIIETWSILPCGHVFGSYCIKHYLNIVADNRPSCPVCRQIAYHKCGHPVLPVLLDDPDNQGEMGASIVEASDHFVEDMKLSPCGYCEQDKKAAPAAAANTTNKGKRIDGRRRRLAAIASSRRRITIGAWLRTLVLTFRPGRRRTGSRNDDVILANREEHQEEDNANNEVEGNGNSRSGGWQGPYIDPFPRPRDYEWEKWWTLQEPSGA
ncbi:hypothetical protein QBC46DRAFT_342406 [Diplogelasinospora grovesii]|uniref:RING-type domain-containing protein n=1 Tax=Diplogelasinospora grovesii TaxID=303347 RepID=A0AAN6N960_9PEZI|nr:hypothetical protein QBC46DRAFT_342406 [Diplogelasinospora grovesii]